jgi:hypothetical protein
MDFATLAIPGLVTLVGSGFGTAIVNYWLTERKAKRELRLGKLEQLFSATRKYGGIHRAALVRFHAVMLGKLPFQDAEDNYDRVGKERSDDEAYAQIQMLIDFYYPELRPQLENLRASRKSAFRIFNEFREAQLKGNPIAPFADPFYQSLEDLLDKENDICYGASALARSTLNWKIKKRFISG